MFDGESENADVIWQKSNDLNKVQTFRTSSGKNLLIQLYSQVDGSDLINATVQFTMRFRSKSLLRGLIYLARGGQTFWTAGHFRNFDKAAGHTKKIDFSFYIFFNENTKKKKNRFFCGVARGFLQISENGPRSKKFGHLWPSR